MKKITEKINNKKVMIVGICLSSALLLAFALPNQARKAKLSSGIHQWNLRINQIKANYINTSIEQLNNVLADLDIFENAFKNIAQTREKLQLNAIRQSITDLIEQKRRDALHTSAPTPPPGPETAPVPSTIPQPTRDTFANDLDQWHTNYLQLQHVRYATTSLATIQEIITEFAQFAQNAQALSLSPTEQETITEIKNGLAKLAQSKQGDEQVKTAEQTATQEFVQKLKVWKKRIEDLKSTYTRISLEELTKTLAEFEPFEQSAHETRINDQDQEMVNALYQTLKKLKSDKKLEEVRAKKSPATAQETQLFNTLLVLWNQIEALNESIEVDGIICSTHQPMIRDMEQQLAAITTNQTVHPLIAQLAQQVSKKLTEEIVNKYQTTQTCAGR